MIKLVITGRATSERPRADALNHLKSVHGPLVYDAPSDAGAMPCAYVQNHVIADFALPQALEDWRGAGDLVTEVWFEDIGHLRASTGTPYYLANLRPDEGRFVDQSSVRAIPTEEEREGRDAGDTAVKVFVFLKAPPNHESFETSWAQARSLSRGDCMAQAASRPLKAPNSPPPWISGVWSIWFSSRAAAEAFAANSLPGILAGFGRNVEHDGSFILAADEYPVSRLRRENAFRVAS